MCGSSNSSSESNGISEKTYKDTTTANPYVTSHTNNSGTTTNFNGGALNDIYNFTNSNMNNLLNEYLNPSLNTTTNQAKMNSFMTNLGKQTQSNVNNNIINPMYQRNMLRSSATNDMYNQLAKTNAESIADYQNQLLANSQNDTANVINNLYNLYSQGYNIASGNQAQSLQASTGNAVQTNNKTAESTAK